MENSQLIEKVFQESYNKVQKENEAIKKEKAEKREKEIKSTSKQADLFIETFSFLKKYNFSFQKVFEYDSCSFSVTLFRYNNYALRIHFSNKIPITDKVNILTTYPCALNGKYDFTFEAFSKVLAEYVANNKI